jgi:hypothetical protein
LSAARLRLVSGDVEGAAQLAGMVDANPALTPTERLGYLTPLLDDLAAKLESRLPSLLVAGQALNLQEVSQQVIDELA